MATTTHPKKNGTPVENVECAPTDLQAIGAARLAEVRASLTAHCTDLNTARYGIREDVRTIRTENLHVYGRKADGSAYKDWKELVTELLGDSLQDWSDRSRKAFIIMLVDEGYTPEEAAEVTGEQDPAKAGPAAVKEAGDQAAGTTPEPATPATPPVPLTPEQQLEQLEQKAGKVATQSLAQNKRLLDVMFDLSEADLTKLIADHEVVVDRLKGMKAHRASRVAA